jgi:hypothetical protein
MCSVSLSNNVSSPWTACLSFHLSVCSRGGGRKTSISEVGLFDLLRIFLEVLRRRGVAWLTVLVRNRLSCKPRANVVNAFSKADLRPDSVDMHWKTDETRRCTARVQRDRDRDRDRDREGTSLSFHLFANLPSCIQPLLLLRRTFCPSSPVSALHPSIYSGGYLSTLPRNDAREAFATGIFFGRECCLD